MSDVCRLVSILTVVSLSLDGLRSRSFSLEFGGGGLNFEDDSLG